MDVRPKGPQASRLRQRKFELLRRFQLPDELLPASLSLSNTRCGKPTCPCASGPGHPAWSLTVSSGWLWTAPEPAIPRSHPAGGGARDSEYAAGQRLLQRAPARIGRRFAQYVAADGALATAPFLHTAGQLGLPVVARLKGNLPELSQSAQRLFGGQPPQAVFQYGADRVELWDADDFPPWATLRWERGRGLRYRQHKPDRTVIPAEWLTDFPRRQVGSFNLFRLANNRGEIENQAFNEGQNRYGLEHIGHHHPNSMRLHGLLNPHQRGPPPLRLAPTDI